MMGPRNIEHSTPSRLIPTPGLIPKRPPPHHRDSTLPRATKESGFPNPLASGPARDSRPPSLIPTTDGTPMPRASLIILCLLFLFPFASAQDAATGAIHGTVVDLHDLRIPGATIAVVNTATGARYSATSDAASRFSIHLLPPGDYSARAVAKDMSPQITPQLHVDVGAAAELEFHLTIAGAQEKVTVSGAPQLVETQPSAVSSLIDERAIADLPINGRR